MIQNNQADGTSVPDKPASYSVTSLMVYETCPLQYHTTYVRHIPPPVTRAMKTGTNIHALIAEHLSRPQLLLPDLEPDVREMLERFQASRFCLTPVAVEESFVLPFQRGNVRGRIDVVLPRPGGGLEIVDFKSGRPRTAADVSGHLQLPLYAMAIARQHGLQPEDLAYTYYYLREGQEVSFSATEAGFGTLTARVDGVMQAIQEGRFDPPRACGCHACRWDRQFRARRRGVATEPR